MRLMIKDIKMLAIDLDGTLLHDVCPFRRLRRIY